MIKLTPSYARVQVLFWLAIAALLGGCGSSEPAGEAWAEKQLGRQAAEKLRADMLALLGIEFSGGITTMPKNGKTPYLPRPYVVFDQMLDPKNPNKTLLVYAPMNTDRGFNLRATDPRGIVILQKDTRSAGRDRKGRVQLEGFVDITLIDLAANIMTRAKCDKAEGAAVRALLDSLPESAP